jgi:hypothetical protein
MNWKKGVSRLDFDFTLKKYNELCSAISESDYTAKTMISYLTEKHSGKVIVLRHDVDSRIDSALKLAQIEKKYSLNATYYFRANAISRPDIVKSVASLGHEIGYHYEVMDTAKGNHEEAIKLFREILGKFREISDIRTICMHGTPASPYDNLALWKHYDFRDFGITGEGYLSINFDKILYFCDTSRSWKGTRYKVKDVVQADRSYLEDIKSTDDLINLINKGVKNQLYISTHPARWKEKKSESIKDILYQKVKNVGKFMLHYSFKLNQRG